MSSPAGAALCGWSGNLAHEIVYQSPTLTRLRADGKPRTRTVVFAGVGLEAGRDRARAAGGSPDPPATRVLSGMHSTIPTEPIVVDVNLHEPLLTADQVAELLAVPRSSVYEYARRLHHPLPSISFGRHRRFYRSDVAAWLADQRDARS